MELFTSSFSQKFFGLLFFLKQSKAEFEMVADEIADNSLRSALNGISLESCSYAGELKNYAENRGLRSPEHEFNVPENDFSNSEAAADGDELSHICTLHENKLERAYREVLDEAVPFQHLREIMLYQLNTLKYTFAKIKMLNSARFSIS